MGSDLIHRTVLALVLLAAATARAEEVVIGAPLSLTGPYAFVGPDVQRGMQLAADQVNSGQTMGAGRTLRIVFQDDGSDRTQSITLVNRMVAQDKVVAIAGPSSTVNSMAAAPVANDLKVPMLGIAVSPAVTKAGPWSFHLTAPPNLLMTSLASYVVGKLKPRTVMTVHGRDNEGAVAQMHVLREALQGKVTLLPEESAPMAESNFSALATKIAAVQPDVVVITMGDTGAANLIVQCREAGVEEKTVFVGNNATVSASYLRIGGAAVEGSYMAADAFVQARRDPVATRFATGYRQRFGTEPSQWAALGYTLIEIYSRVVAKIDGPVTHDAVRDGLGRLQDFQTVLGEGSFGFDADREPRYQPLILTVAKGAFQLAP